MASNDHSVSDEFPELSRSTDRQDTEYLESNLKKLEELKKLCFDKSLDQKLLQKCLENIHVETFLNNQVFTQKHHHDINSISTTDRRYIICMLLEKEKLNQDASEISKKNRQLEKKIIKQKMQLKEYIKQRRKIMNEVTRLCGFISGKLTTLQYLNSSDSLLGMEKLKEKDRYLKDMPLLIAGQTSRITLLSRILHNLICFSGKSWATDKDLLEIIFCTGEMLGKRFNVENQQEFKKVIDDVLYRLNCVKI